VREPSQINPVSDFQVWSFAVLKDNGFLVVVAMACLALMGIGGIIAQIAN
jgi:hypothetical protein